MSDYESREEMDKFKVGNLIINDRLKKWCIYENMIIEYFQ